MRRLVARGTELTGREDVLDMLDADRGVPPPDRPWVTTNMVMSLDGAYAFGGTSGGLSSDADHALFLAQRSLADVILVGASTVREERYRRPTTDAGVRAIRDRHGQEPVPRVVITSRSLHLPADTPLLEGEPPPPIMAHPADADTTAAPAGVELLEVGTDGVDPGALLSELHTRGARLVVCEGGPGLLGQLAAADLVDEYLLTLSPKLVGGDRVGLLAGAEAADGSFGLHRALQQDDHLMLCYRRRRA